MVSTRELEALAAQVDREVAEHAQRVAELRSRPIEQPIGGGIGVVKVGLFGDLRGIELDPDALRFISASRLGPMVLDAVHAAEQAAARVRVAALAEAS